MSVCDIVGIGNGWGICHEFRRMKGGKGGSGCRSVGYQISTWTTYHASGSCASSRGRRVIVHNIYFSLSLPFFACACTRSFVS